jgi:hypothetical protein
LKDFGFLLEDFWKIIFLHAEIFEFVQRYYYDAVYPYETTIGKINEDIIIYLLLFFFGSAK